MVKKITNYLNKKLDDWIYRAYNNRVLPKVLNSPEALTILRVIVNTRYERLTGIATVDVDKYPVHIRKSQ